MFFQMCTFFGIDIENLNLKKEYFLCLKKIYTLYITFKVKS